MSVLESIAVANALVAPGLGILALDESTATIGKRLQSVGCENTEEKRRLYRQMLLTTNSLGDFISGVILYEETLFQKTDSGISFVKVLEEEGIFPGVKVDKGTHILAGGKEGEVITEGLDGLRYRLEKYGEAGARFTKWRGVLKLSDGYCSRACIQANAWSLARFAALSQEQGLAPIVEPEILMEGDHSMEHCYETTVEVLEAVFEALKDQNVLLEGMVLKMNMVTAGSFCKKKPSVEEVAEETVLLVQRIVPAAVPGIAFLSGGQGDVLATEHLQAINSLGSFPWTLTFSYGRALQSGSLKIWGATSSHVEEAQQHLYYRASLNSKASLGKYEGEIT